MTQSTSLVSKWVGISSVALLVAGCSSSKAIAPFVPAPGPGSGSSVTTPPTAPGSPGTSTPLPGGGCSPTPGPTDSPAPAPSPASPVVCNPFGDGGGSLGDRHGLIGQLWYAPGDYDDFRDVRDFEDFGFKFGTPLYFDQLNVPTRIFKEGFKVSDGSVIKTVKGDTLIDYYALRFDSVIRLSSHEKPGRYQFAILADDGAVVRIGRRHADDDDDDDEDDEDDEDGDVDGLRVLINNDGYHPSRLGCAKRGVWFDRDTRRPIRVDYFQGARYHMALVLLWRKLPEHDLCLYDPACGREGNDEFFDADYTPSKPEPTWIHMLARGWKVVGAENFVLPEGGATNPCVSPTPDPSPTVTPSPTATPSPTMTPQPSPSASPSPTPTPSFVPIPS